MAKDRVTTANGVPQTGPGEEVDVERLGIGDRIADNGIEVVVADRRVTVFEGKLAVRLVVELGDTELGESDIRSLDPLPYGTKVERTEVGPSITFGLN